MKYQAEAHRFEKSDVLISLFLGGISAVFLMFVLKNLERDLYLIRSMANSFWFLLILVPAFALGGIYITFLLGKVYNFILFQIGKFCVVGVSNTAVDFGILNLLILLTGIESGYYYSIFKAISFVVAVLHSYLWNRVWAFKSKGKGVKRVEKEFFQFLSVSTLGFGINVGTASFVVNFIGPRAGISPTLWANIGAISAVLFSSTWDFLGYKFIVFKKGRKR